MLINELIKIDCKFHGSSDILCLLYLTYQGNESELKYRLVKAKKNCKGEYSDFITLWEIGKSEGYDSGVFYFEKDPYFYLNFETTVIFYDENLQEIRYELRPNKEFNIFNPDSFFFHQ